MSDYEYLDIEYNGPSASEKTGLWAVLSKHGDELGVVRWFGRWRQYCFYPEPDCAFSAGCLADIQDFLRSAKDVYRECSQARPQEEELQ